MLDYYRTNSLTFINGLLLLALDLNPRRDGFGLYEFCQSISLRGLYV
jgi:hypothetical protein